MAVPKTIHFIWWGNPKGKYEDAAFWGPNCLARGLAKNRDLNKEWKVKYWYDGKYETYFLNELEYNIERQPIENLNIPTIPGNNGSLHSDVIKTLRSLKRRQAYSAMKDLFEMYILHVQGGFYFDTTTYMPDPAIFFQALATETENTLPQFIFNSLTMQFGYSQELGQFEQFIDLESSVFAGEKPNRLLDIPAPDYWAVASKKECPIFRGCAERYVQRWYYIKRDRGNELSNEKKLKPGVVSNLIDWSVKDTLIKHYNKNRDEIKKHGFLSFSLSRIKQIMFTPKAEYDKENKQYISYERKPKNEIEYEDAYKDDSKNENLKELFKYENIESWKDYKKFLIDVDSKFVAANKGKQQYVQWIPKYKFFKRSGQTWKDRRI